MSDYRMSFRECRQLERAARRAQLKRTLVVVAVLVACIAFTLALWQFWPRTAFGSTHVQPVATVELNERTLLAQVQRGPVGVIVGGGPVVTPTPQGVK